MAALVHIRTTADLDRTSNCGTIRGCVRGRKHKYVEESVAC